ncbi:MAG: hypothetical protein QW320_11105 [Ignisphaera sp.]
MSQSQTQIQNMPQTQTTKKYKLVDMRELCIVHGIPYDNDVDVNPSEFVFVDEEGEEWDMASYFEGVVILGMFEDDDKLYVIVEIPSPTNIGHDIDLWVFERVE